jgi:hypothetical protein
MEEMKDPDDLNDQHPPATPAGPGAPQPAPDRQRRPSKPRDDDPRRMMTRSECGDILTVDGTRARALEPTLRAAGYTVMPQQHDDLVNIHDEATGLYISISDENGGRLLLRSCFVVRSNASTEARHDAINELNASVWAKAFLDDDGDVLMTHSIGCTGGVHLPNLMRTIRSFFGLGQFIGSHPKYREVFGGPPSDDGLVDRE